MSRADVVAALLDYCTAVDRRDATAVAASFTSDAELRLVSGRAKGRDEIVAAFRSAFADTEVSTTHMVARPDVAIDTDGRAALRADLTVWRRSSDTTQVGSGSYEARLVAEGSDWKFQEMTVTLDGPLITVSPPPTGEG